MPETYSAHDTYGMRTKMCCIVHPRHAPSWPPTAPSEHGVCSATPVGSSVAEERALQQLIMATAATNPLMHMQAYSVLENVHNSAPNSGPSLEPATTHAYVDRAFGHEADRYHPWHHSQRLPRHNEGALTHVTTATLPPTSHAQRHSSSSQVKDDARSTPNSGSDACWPPKW